MIITRARTDLVVLHHSASPASTTLDQIRRWHTDPPPAGRGFSDIGYHLLIWSDGHVETGRPLHLVGAHCRGVNNRSVGVCLVGCFDNSPGDVHAPPSAQWSAALGVVADLCRRYGIRTDQVVGHREISSTLCPGSDAGLFRRDLAALLSANQPTR